MVVSSGTSSFGGTATFNAQTTFNTNAPISNTAPTLSTHLTTKNYTDSTFQTIANMVNYLTTATATNIPNNRRNVILFNNCYSISNIPNDIGNV